METKTLFPQEVLFWELVHKEREMWKMEITWKDRQLYLLGYKWGWSNSKHERGDY